MENYCLMGATSQQHKKMPRIRSKDTSIELILRKALWNHGIRYMKNYKRLSGTSDIAITKYRIAIFCDSEFFMEKTGRSFSHVWQMVPTAHIG